MLSSKNYQNKLTTIGSYRSFLLRKKSIEDRASQIYMEWQELRFKTLGYIWSRLKGSDVIGVIDIKFYSSYIIINYLRGYEFKLPIEWLEDPNWGLKAVELFKIEQSKELIKKLEE